MPEYLDVEYMCIVIMRVFSAYTMNLLLELPFCHVLALYHMAEKAVSLFRFDILIGNASLHDEQMAKGLQRVAKTATIADRQKMKELTSKRNREAIMKRAREKRLVHA